MICRFKYLLLFPLLLSISGCAHVISRDIRINSDLSLTLREVSSNPSVYQGKRVIWGGEIIEVLNQKDGTTQIEVFQKPLRRTGEPVDQATSEGRFLVLVDHYLDPYLYQKGKKITIAGELIGEKIQPLGKMDYRYPLLSGKQIHLWREYYYSPPPYYYYDPWWDYPYFPRGYWGIGIYYRHYPPRYRHR